MYLYICIDVSMYRCIGVYVKVFGNMQHLRVAGAADSEKSRWCSDG